jgi:hypothetical protein
MYHTDSNTKQMICMVLLCLFMGPFACFCLYCAFCPLYSKRKYCSWCGVEKSTPEDAKYSRWFREKKLVGQLPKPQEAGSSNAVKAATVDCEA